MPKSDPTLQKVRAICLALPDTKETLTWGNPHFRVGEKIFCGFGDATGEPSIGFKMEKDVAFVIDPGEELGAGARHDRRELSSDRSEVVPNAEGKVNLPTIVPAHDS